MDDQRKDQNIAEEFTFWRDSIRHGDTLLVRRKATRGWLASRARIDSNKKIRVEKIISQGQTDGSIRNDIEPDQLASVFMGSMRFTILQWRLNNYNTDLRKEGDLLWVTLSNLIRK